MGKGKKRRSRSKEREDKISKKEESVSKSVAVVVDADEQKKLERQEAWKKAKLAMMQEVMTSNEVEKTTTPTTTTTSLAPPVSVVSSFVSSSSSSPVPTVVTKRVNVFGDDDDDDNNDDNNMGHDGSAQNKKKSLEHLLPFGPGDDVGGGGDGVNEEDGKDETLVKKKKIDEKEEEEEDELDKLVAGFQAEHEKLLKQGGSSNGNSGLKRRNDDYDEDNEYDGLLTKSDEEIFLGPDGGPVGGGGGQKKKALPTIDHSKMRYETFRKDFYIETESIRRMSDADVKDLRKRLDHIRVRGKGCPKPIVKFVEAGLSDAVLSALEKSGFSAPTPIQAQALPAIMSGRDVIGIARTGSGKTLAYVLPMLRHVLDQRPLEEREGPIALVLVPTRELCMQIAQEFKRFKNTGVRAVAVYGGSDVSFQIGSLKRGCEVVVATPGRLIDILSINNGRITNLSRVTYLVLDEADRMFDMGFAPQITRIVENIRPDKQAVMFSATFPTSIELLARKALVSPIEIVVGGRLQVCGDVDQNIELVTPENKFMMLLKALGDWSPKGQILIFTESQESVDNLYRRLQENGYNSMTLHGGKDQLDRISTISDFKAGMENILIATSVAARGLDVRNLILVVNYDVPNHIEDYVHRVGRTGRAGRKGTAITFITEDEARYAPALMKALVEAKKDVPPKLAELVQNYKKKVETGEVKDYRLDGFKNTKGFSFTGDEAKKKRKMEMAAYGIEFPSSESEEEEGSDEVVVESDKLLKKIDEDPIRKIQSGLSVDQVQLQNASAIGSGVKRAADIARALAQQSALPDEEGMERFQTEVEINDFPQNARFKVSSKESIDGVLEMFPGVIMLVKGTHVPPGRKPLGNERKLYVELSGRHEMDVKLARREVIRILKEASQESFGVARERYSKYSVI